MKFRNLFVYLIVLTALILAQPVCAKLAVPYKQAVIMIDQINTDKKIIEADGVVYEVISTKVLNLAQTIKSQQVRVLYITVGGKFTITDIKPATAEPFIIPVKEKTITSPQ